MQLDHKQGKSNAQKATFQASWKDMSLFSISGAAAQAQFEQQINLQTAVVAMCFAAA